MNVLGKRERSWRKARKRGVSPIIATILLVAITVVLAAVLYVLISGLTSGGANTVPIGTTFAYGTAQQTTNSLCAGTAAGQCYVIGIQSAGSSATTANIHFGVLSAGSGVTFAAVYLVSVAASTTAIATYTGGTTNAWTAGTLPSTFTSTDQLILCYATSGTGSASGYTLEAIGVGALSGTTTVALP